MLVSLYIKNFALIDELRIEFGPGFNVVTGETGSGKSVVLQALQLALGARAEGVSFYDPDVKCVLELEIAISAHYKQWFEAYDLDYDKHCIIRREMGKTQKSRIFINDTPVKQTVLNQLTDKLFSFHSQNESYSFLKNAEQLDFLDEQAQHQDVVDEYRKKYRSYKALSDEFEALTDRSEEMEREWAYQQHLKSELDALNLEHLNQEDLESRYEILNQGEKIQSIIDELNGLFESEPYGLNEQLRQAQRLSSSLLKASESFSEINNRMQSLAIEAQDLYVEINQSLESMDLEPSALEEVSELLSELHRLQQKHGVSNVEELKAKRDAFATSLGEDGSYADRIKAIESALLKAREEIEPLAVQISDGRKKAATALSVYIEKVLSSLEMPGSRIAIEVYETEHLGSNGINEVNFKFQANKGSDLLELKKVVSGGELSRLALAIQYIKGEKNSIPTQVFDEIDTGVSGQVAERVAQLFEAMGTRNQLLIITHLPQVAAKGSTHLKVFKKEADGRVNTRVVQLTENARQEEIASMIEGNNPSETALSHARTLLTRH
jgi:DNA repair protein RecN (Recombination protein N)